MLHHIEAGTRHEWRARGGIHDWERQSEGNRVHQNERTPGVQRRSDQG